MKSNCAKSCPAHKDALQVLIDRGVNVNAIEKVNSQTALDALLDANESEGEISFIEARFVQHVANNLNPFISFHFS